MQVLTHRPWPQADSSVPLQSQSLPLRVDGLCFSVNGQALLRDISFCLDSPQPTLLLGHNGAGKSVLLRLLHGLLTPTAGMISWGGMPPAQAARHQAMVFQRPVMLRRSVIDNIIHALALRDVPRRLRRDIAAAALEESGLGPLAHRQARVLSGGEQQLVALARARALTPAVLFLDEPTASLDPVHSAAVERAVGAIVASGVKVIMASHDLGQARRLAGDVLFMAGGRLVEQGPADLLFHAPRTEEARRYLSGDIAA